MGARGSRRAAVAAAILGLLALASCGLAQEGDATPVVEGADPAARWDAAADGTVDYQLGGAYDLEDGTTVVARDASDPPADDAFSICYLNGFQSQPGDAELWLEEHPDLLLRDAAGEPMIDPGWPDEMALDTSTEASRDGIAAIVEPWIDGCADAGYDAVELDNLDTWTRFDGLDRDGNLALAATLVDAIHDRGMWAAQKNALEAGEGGPDAGFDMVVTEECGQFGECADYAALYGDRHLDVEYVESTSEDEFQAMCDAGDVPARSVLRDLALTVAGEPGYVRAACDAP